MSLEAGVFDSFPWPQSAAVYPDIRYISWVDGAFATVTYAL